jgi:hypothetical protein
LSLELAPTFGAGMQQTSLERFKELFLTAPAGPSKIG